MSLDMWIAYVFAMLVISISPCSGCINALSTSLSDGFRHTTPAITGLQVGLLIQLTVVGIGLGAIFVTSPAAFLALQWARCSLFSLDWSVQTDMAEHAVGL